jgi:hypothetical protein
MFWFVNFLFFSLLFLGSWGWQGQAVEIPLVLMSVFLLVVWLVAKQKVPQIPQTYYLYGLVLALMTISLWWSIDPEQGAWWLMLYASGGLIWLIGHGFKEKLEQWLAPGLVWLTVGLGLLWLVTEVGGRNFLGFGSQSLIIWGSAFHNHNHLGDVAALALLVIVRWLLNGKSKWWLVLGFGFSGLVWMSLSRSAYLSLMVGLWFLGKQVANLKARRHLLHALYVLIALGFVIASMEKGIVRNRDYWIQAIVGVVAKPLGVGMGNFETFSRGQEYQVMGLDGFSFVTHNIGLEFMSGLGVFSLIFISWLVVVARQVLNQQQKLMAILWMALTINFVFDSTYQIPTMVWLWFLFLAGVLGSEEHAWKRRWGNISFWFTFILIALGIGFYGPITFMQLPQWFEELFYQIYVFRVEKFHP